jgi:hypothetical protein
MLLLNNNKGSTMITTKTKTKTKGDIVDEVYRDHYKLDLKHMTMLNYISFERWLQLYQKDYDRMAQRMAQLRGEV